MSNSVMTVYSNVYSENIMNVEKIFLFRILGRSEIRNILMKL